MPQRDTLPEHQEYRDTGCPDLGIPACTGCPLPECRYLMPQGQAKALLAAARLRALLTEGRTVEDAASEIGVVPRSAYRWLGKYGVGAAERDGA